MQEEYSPSPKLRPQVSLISNLSISEREWAEALVMSCKNSEIIVFMIGRHFWLEHVNVSS